MIDILVKIILIACVMFTYMTITDRYSNWLITHFLNKWWRSPAFIAGTILMTIVLIIAILAVGLAHW